MKNRRVYENMVTALLKRLKGVDLKETVHGTWVDEQTGECCPILAPMRDLIRRLRLKSRTKPKEPDMLPPVTKQMIRYAVAALGLHFRTAERFAQEFDCAVNLGEPKEQAVLYAIRAAALYEERHWGTAHLIPPVAVCARCGLIIRIENRKLVWHVDLFATGQVCQAKPEEYKKPELTRADDDAED